MIVAIFAVLMFSGGFLLFKENQRLTTFMALLVAISSTYLLLPTLAPQNHAWAFLGAMSCFLTASFILGAVIQHKWLKVIIPFVIVAAMMILGDAELTFGSYTLNLSLPKIILLPFLGAILMAILDVKMHFIQRLFPEVDVKTAERSIVLLVIGLFSIIATFMASWFGFYFMAIGALIYNLFAVSKREYIPIALISISVLAFFTTQLGVEAIDLSIGKVIAGFFVGAGIVGITAVAIQMNKKIVAVLLLLASIGLIMLVLSLNAIHPAYGGVESFVAAILGIAFANLYFQHNGIGSFLLPASVVIGLTLPSDPFAESGIESIQPIGATAPKSDKKESIVASQTGLSLEEIVGSYSIEESSSVISFQLGPKGGITKGEIKGFKGKINIAESIEKSTFSVTIPVVNLSTFNAMRDESLMDVEYFNEEKFPTMSFTSSSLEAKEDGYILKGKFTLLGKSNEQEVFIKYVGDKDGKQILVGESSLDKTKYGMEPSPQEGDVVSFSFQILLVP